MSPSHQQWQSHDGPLMAARHDAGPGSHAVLTTRNIGLQSTTTTQGLGLGLGLEGTWI